MLRVNANIHKSYFKCENKPNILIVYTNYNKIKQFVIDLKKSGYCVTLYKDPKLALDNYLPSFYSLLLVEIRLCGMSGFELYSYISKIEKVPICFFTNLYSYYMSLIEFYFIISCFVTSN